MRLKKTLNECTVGFPFIAYVGGSANVVRAYPQGDVSDDRSIRSVYRKLWVKLSTLEVIDACSVLEEFGWLRHEAVKTSGRSTTRLRLHPILREQP
jgi:hypothetical protein